MTGPAIGRGVTGQRVGCQCTGSKAFIHTGRGLLNSPRAQGKQGGEHGKNSMGKKEKVRVDDSGQIMHARERKGGERSDKWEE